MSAERQHSTQGDFEIARRGIQGFRDPLSPSAALNALQRIEQRLEAAQRVEQNHLNFLAAANNRIEELEAVARRILYAPKGTSKRQFRFWLMDALGASYPASEPPKPSGPPEDPSLVTGRWGRIVSNQESGRDK